MSNNKDKILILFEAGSSKIYTLYLESCHNDLKSRFSLVFRPLSDLCKEGKQPFNFDGTLNSTDIDLTKIADSLGTYLVIPNDIEFDWETGFGMGVLDTSDKEKWKIIL